MVVRLAGQGETEPRGPPGGPPGCGTKAGEALGGGASTPASTNKGRARGPPAWNVSAPTNGGHC